MDSKNDTSLNGTQYGITEDDSKNLSIIIPEDCPLFTEENNILIGQMSFYIEGISLCCIAIPGFLGNIGSGYILSSKGMNFFIYVITCDVI